MSYRILTINLCLESENRSVSNWAKVLHEYDLVALQESTERDNTYLGDKIARKLGWNYVAFFDPMKESENDFDQCIISPFEIPIYVRSIHLSNTKDSAGRTEELRNAVNFNNDLIVMGDFNEDISGLTHREMENHGYNRVEVSSHTHPTNGYYPDDPPSKLDFIYLKEFRLISASHVDFGLSDHFGVEAIIF